MLRQIDKDARKKAEEHIFYCKNSGMSPLTVIESVVHFTWADVRHFLEVEIRKGKELPPHAMSGPGMIRMEARPRPLETDGVKKAMKCLGGCGKTFVTDNGTRICPDCKKSENYKGGEIAT